MAELHDIGANCMSDDKENCQGKHADATNQLEDIVICKRTPLQNANCDRNNGGQPIFSPVTPVSGAKSEKKSSGKASKMSCHSRRAFWDRGNSSFPLNTLVYNKAKKVIEQALQEEKDKQEEMKELLQEKDENIQILKAEIDRLSKPTITGNLSEDKSIMTSPVLATALVQQQTFDRLSEVIHPGNIQEELKSKLETTEIINSILRSELASTKQSLERLQPELLLLRESAGNTNRRIDEAVQQAEALSQQRISELLDSQSQLTSSILVFEKEVSSCRNELQLSQEQRLHEVAALNGNIARLQEDLCIVYRQKQQETDLCKEYRCQNQANFQARRELEAQLNEYVKIMPNLKRAKLAQYKLLETMHEANRVLIEKKKQIASEAEEFLKQKVDWLKWKDEKENSFAEAQEEWKGLLEKYAEFEHQKTQLADCLMAAESRIEGLLKNVASLETCLQVETKEKLHLMERLNVVEKEISVSREWLAVEVKMRENEVTNLQRTIDMREHDFDELMTEQQNYRKLLARMKEQVTKQQSIISKVSDLEIQIKLLEKEKMAVCIEMLDVRKNLSETTQKLQQLTTDNKVLQDELSYQKEKSQSLELSLVDTEERLLTKETELTNTLDLIETLRNNAVSVYEKLTAQWKSWKKSVKETPLRRRSVARTPTLKSRRRSSRGVHSIVGQTLSTVKRSVQKLKIQNDVQDTENVDDVQSHVEVASGLTCEIQTPPQIKRADSLDATVSDGSDLVGLYSLSSHGDCSASMLNEVAGIFLKMESLLTNEVTVAFMQLKTVSKNLELRLAAEKQNHVKQMREAQDVVQQVIFDAKGKEQAAKLAMLRSAELEAELLKSAGELEQFRTFFSNQGDYLTELSEQKKEIQKLSAEVDSSRNLCNLKHEEIQLLKTTVDERLLLVNANSGPKMAVMIKDMNEEIAKLKVQKQNLLSEKSNDKRTWEASVYKLQDQNRIAMVNIKKAEEAIKELDNKIERIRVALRPHTNSLKDDEELCKVLMEIHAFD